MFNKILRYVRSIVHSSFLESCSSRVAGKAQKWAVESCTHNVSDVILSEAIKPGPKPQA